MNKHKQILIDKYAIKVDENMKDCIEALNDAGFKTLFSCQGDECERAYIMFAPCDLEHITSHLVPIFIDTPNTKCEISAYPLGEYVLILRPINYVELGQVHNELNTVWIKDITNIALKRKKVR